MTNLGLDVRHRSHEYADEVIEDIAPLWTTVVDAELHFERRETLQYAAETLSPAPVLADLTNTHAISHRAGLTHTCQPDRDPNGASCHGRADLA